MHCQLSSGTYQDKFVTRCKKITEQIDETELDIGYTFMTEADMEAASFPQPPVLNLLVGIKLADVF